MIYEFAMVRRIWPRTRFPTLCTPHARALSMKLFGLLRNAANVVAHRTVLLVPMSARRSPQQTNGKNGHGCYTRKKPHVQILSRYTDNTSRFRGRGHI
jgi:hypothetical protein